MQKHISVATYDRRSADLPINSVVATVDVDDPLEPGAKLTVFRSVRDDPLAAMFARGQIDQALLEAGRRWQDLHYLSEIGGVAAMDPGKEFVDGGRMREPLTDQQIDAFKALNEAHSELGYQGTYLMRVILGERKTVQQAAMRLGMTTDREFNYISRRFRECLETLAGLWGFAMRRS